MRSRLLGITLVSFLSLPLFSQDSPPGAPPGGGWVEHNGPTGADGRPFFPDKHNSGVQYGKPWSACGEGYREQFNQEGKKYTREERKDLEKRVIPYAMSTTRDINLVDLDGDAKPDFVSVKSISRVQNCSYNKDFLTKDNEVYIETTTGPPILVSWAGPLVVNYTTLQGTPLIKVGMVDVEGVMTYKYINHKIALPNTLEQK